MKYNCNGVFRDDILVWIIDYVSLHACKLLFYVSVEKWMSALVIYYLMTNEIWMTLTLIAMSGWNINDYIYYLDVYAYTIWSDKRSQKQWYWVLGYMTMWRFPSNYLMTMQNVY